MIIEYNNKYDEDIKRLLEELQIYIASLDEEGYNIVTREFKEKNFIETMEEVEKYEGKILLYQEDNYITGLIIGIINNEEEETYNFIAPKRGRITELIVSHQSRSKGTGTKLLKAMEDYLKSVGCEDILLGVFAYNEKAKNFYEKHGYHNRMIDMTKKLN
jgi:ribosomal protein S18 acetylase RimI-like enzyme